MDKASLRNEIKLKRRQLSHEFRQKAARSLVNQFQKSEILKSLQHIALYLSHDNEMDLNPLIQDLWQQGKKLYLPMIQKEELCFLPYTQSTLLKPNRFGILEPEFNASQAIEPSKLDAVLMPLMAFDQYYHRLGTGGGYYDRAFASRKTKKPLLIGCAYQFQYYDKLPTEPHDVAMDIVVSEERTYHLSPCGRGRA